MREMNTVRLLGKGSYGSVSLVRYEGQLAARKEMNSNIPKWFLLREARLSVELNGAGGVPRTLAICLNPPVVMLEFVGD